MKKEKGIFVYIEGQLVHKKECNVYNNVNNKRKSRGD